MWDLQECETFKNGKLRLYQVQWRYDVFFACLWAVDVWITELYFNQYFNTLYQMLEDDYTKQFSDKLDECAQEGVTYRDKYLSTP